MNGKKTKLMLIVIVQQLVERRFLWASDIRPKHWSIITCLTVIVPDESRTENERIGRSVTPLT